MFAVLLNIKILSDVLYFEKKGVHWLAEILQMCQKMLTEVYIINIKYQCNIFVT